MSVHPLRHEAPRVLDDASDPAQLSEARLGGLSNPDDSPVISSDRRSQTTPGIF
jgi:hypothetical protein